MTKKESQQFKLKSAFEKVFVDEKFKYSNITELNKVVRRLSNETLHEALYFINMIITVHFTFETSLENFVAQTAKSDCRLVLDLYALILYINESKENKYLSKYKDKNLDDKTIQEITNLFKEEIKFLASFSNFLIKELGERL